ncbi:fatty acid--CoA ligase [Sphingopyxis panaciterrulae]|uniref:3-methylmercaptopropionyl-CoA ligase n=1 Tax=Sphingopyxis panaciterrulae TaxID=462372 RepID=A0A7W9B6R5_9SPHN|nr:fatty acid--CoA ligase [Sphingopyxis panaciterrulae]MBB5707273.1 fatty-acyl-CoA synthase [Sphingopyxis panaciterrulae]
MAGDVSALFTFDEFLTHWAEDRPDRVAMREEGRVFTYGEIEDRTARVASALLAAGLKKGDRIAWIGKNSDLYFTLFFGAARAGIVMAPIGWRLSPAEWAFIVNDTRAKIVFTGPGFDGVPQQLAGRLDHGPRIVGADAARAMIDAAARIAFAPSGRDDAVLQLYTSGTTGNPKGAVLTNTNLFGLRKHSADLDMPYTKWEDDEAVLVAMPCAHIGGTGLGIMALAAGLPGVILAEFNPDGVFDAVEQHGVTRFFIVPAALQMLLLHPRCGSVDYSRLKYILYGAAPIPLELLRQCIQMFGAQFIQAYGMTETTGTISMLPPEDHDPEGNKRMRSAGKPLPGVEIRIVGADGAEVPTGEVGEVVTRSSNNMQGYWNLPEATAKTMTGDGWIRTGDAGYMDEDGYLYIHDRVKDMIITGGENVYPAEVESAIYGHPAVQEVAVIGIPDDKWGETVKAVVVPKPGMTVEEDDIIAWTRDRIAAFKAPRSVDMIAALPRNASGKILRKDLRAPYWEGYERMVN